MTRRFFTDDEIAQALRDVDGYASKAAILLEVHPSVILRRVRKSAALSAEFPPKRSGPPTVYSDDEIARAWAMAPSNRGAARILGCSQWTVIRWKRGRS